MCVLLEVIYDSPRHLALIYVYYVNFERCVYVLHGRKQELNMITKLIEQQAHRYTSSSYQTRPFQQTPNT